LTRVGSIYSKWKDQGSVKPAREGTSILSGECLEVRSHREGGEGISEKKNRKDSNVQPLRRLPAAIGEEKKKSLSGGKDVEAAKPYVKENPWDPILVRCQFRKKPAGA